MAIALVDLNAFLLYKALGEHVRAIFDQLTLEQVMLLFSYTPILEALFYAASPDSGS